MQTPKHPRPLVPDAYAEPLREWIARERATSLRILYGVPDDEAMRRGREYVTALERAGFPDLGED
jgi:hypothetical protein